MKKRRVVFAAKGENDESDSGESSAFEFDLQEVSALHSFIL